MDPSAILHMNEDHQDALIDYCRYYGGAPYDIADPRLTPNTSSSCMEIAYRFGADGMRQGTCKVPIKKVGRDMRTNFKVMAKEASLARVPRIQFPGPFALALIAALVILGVVTYAPGKTLQTGPLVPLWRSASDALNLVGGGRTGRGLVMFSLVAHIGEGMLVLYRLLQVKKPGGRGNVRITLWVLQTIICGFPSATLVLGQLQAGENARRRKNK